MICGIRWVSELIEIAGGTDVFSAKSRQAGAQGRIVMRDEVVQAAPEVIVGSWCGKKFSPANVLARPELARVPAVIDGALYEIKSSLILQPGPAALTDGLAELHRIIATVAHATPAGAA
jgi:iron complex transport system substrate-binding protein